MREGELCSCVKLKVLNSPGIEKYLELFFYINVVYERERKKIVTVDFFFQYSERLVIKNQNNSNLLRTNKIFLCRLNISQRYVKTRLYSYHATTRNAPKGTLILARERETERG